MIIRLGYVAIALNLDKVTSSSNMTYTRYKKILDVKKSENILKSITRSNIEDLNKIIDYNIDNNIHFYRLTSRLIPLATHPEVQDWDYKKYFIKELQLLGKKINEHKIRVDCHPDQFNVINTLSDKVFINTITNLNHLLEVMMLMDNPYPKMVLHVGGAKGGKEEAIKRFIVNYNKLPQRIKKNIILENDDKVFNHIDVLRICQKISMPMVLDYHHYICNNDKNLVDELGEILSTWELEELPPKIHISSPRNLVKDSRHSDFIKAKNFIELVEMLKIFDKDVDIMIEAKMKDRALFKLVEDINKLKEWKWIDNSTMYIN
ncbi:MAG: UV DNA damage repair endonuclease UvsE [Eubacteriaceae bacterium]